MKFDQTYLPMSSYAPKAKAQVINDNHNRGLLVDSSSRPLLIALIYNRFDAAELHYRFADDENWHVGDFYVGASI